MLNVAPDAIVRLVPAGAVATILMGFVGSRRLQVTRLADFKWERHAEGHGCTAPNADLFGAVLFWRDLDRRVNAKASRPPLPPH